MTTSLRPDPDLLLDKIQREQEKQQRGHLKIFFGACAGVGKTYAMLRAAQQLLQPHAQPQPRQAHAACCHDRVGV